MDSYKMENAILRRAIEIMERRKERLLRAMTEFDQSRIEEEAEEVISSICHVSQFSQKKRGGDSKMSELVDA